MKIFTAATLSIALVWPLAAQWLHYRTPGIPRTADGQPNLSAPAPRTADGKPDLNGLWDMITDAAVGNILVRNAGDLQPTDVHPWARALLQERAENFGKDNPHYKCLPEGPGYTTSLGMKRFLQTPTMLGILNDDLTYRQVFLDGRTLEPEPNPSWMGYSVGRWEGDTLVVESNGFNDKTWLLEGYPHTEGLRMTERYRRIDFGHMEISVTYQDPRAYNKAWTVPLRAQLAADTELLEAVCNENEDTKQQHWIGKASDSKKTAIDVAPEILAKYTGVYKGPYLGRPRTVALTVSGGTLFVSVNGGLPQPVVAQSETMFTGTGLTYQIVRDAQGFATDVIEGHVAGDFKYARQK